MEFYKGAVFMHRGGKEELEGLAAKDPPTSEEVQDMAEYLGLEDGDTAAVKRVARLAVSAPLPPGWTETLDEGGEPTFKNDATGSVQEEHPLDGYFIELVRRGRQGGGDAAKGWPGDLELALTTPRAVSTAAPAVPADTPGSAAALASAAIPKPGSGVAPHSASKDGAKARASPRTRRAEAEATGAGAFPTNTPPGAVAAWGSQLSTPEVMARVQAGEAMFSQRDDAVTDGIPAAPRTALILAKSLLPMSTAKAADEKIRVCIRSRPVVSKERSVWHVGADGVSISLKAGAELKHRENFYGTDRDRAGEGSNQFTFDKVFDASSETCSVYSECVRPIVESAMEGINGTVFAYGQTGSGKTHTIVGTRSDPGVMFLAVEDIFRLMAQYQGSVDYTLKVGMVEIYNEEFKDLLRPPEQRLHTGGSRIQLKEDTEKGVVLQGLFDKRVTSLEQLRQLLASGGAKKQIATTKMNEQSSRSHTIVRLAIESRENSEEGAIRESTLNFVDLAGSERLAKSGAEGTRAVETSQINLSLLMLGNVINKLSEGAESSGEHVPYRNSKLTRLLQPSLGGNARTGIIATVSPSEDHAEETSQTLRFASRAKKVTNKVRVNETLTDAVALKRMRREIAELTLQLQRKDRLLQQAGEEGASGSGGKLLEIAEGLATEHPSNVAIALSQEKILLNEDLVRVEAENAMLRERLEEMVADRDEGKLSSPGPVGSGSSNTAGDRDGGGKRGDKRNLGSVDPAAKELGMGKTISAIGRAVGVYKSSGKNHLVLEELLNAIRSQRSERDELRRSIRLKEAQRENAALQIKQREELLEERQACLAAATALEEALLGDLAEARAPLPVRLQDSAAAAIIMQAEIATAQRVAREAQARGSLVGQRDAALAKQTEISRAAMKESLGMQKDNAVLKDLLGETRNERNEQCAKAGGDPLVLYPETGQVQSIKAQTKYIESLEAKLKLLDSELTVAREEAKATEAAKGAAVGASAYAEMTMPATHGRVKKVLTAVKRCQDLEAAIKEKDAVIEEQDMKLGALGDINVRAAGGARAGAAAGFAAEAAGKGGGTTQIGKLGGENTPAACEGGGSGADVVSQMKERIYALSRESAAAGRERDALKAALITAGMAPAAVLERAARNQSGLQAPGSGRRALLGGDGGEGGSGRQFPISSAVGSGGALIRPHPPTSGRPVGLGTGAAAVMMSGVDGGRKLGKRGAAGAARKAGGAVSGSSGGGAAGGGFDDSPRGSWDDGVAREDGPAASAHEIKHLRKAVIQAERERQEVVKRAAQAARAAQLNLATQSRAAQLNYKEYQKAATAAKGLQQVVARKEGEYVAILDEAETLAAERDAAISQLSAAVEENKRLQAENMEMQFYKGLPA
jgi:centromeric protein E